MKRFYKKAETSPLQVFVENGFLAGSITANQVKTGSVQIEDYGNGFSSEKATADEWSLSF